MPGPSKRPKPRHEIIFRAKVRLDTSHVTDLRTQRGTSAQQQTRTALRRTRPRT